MPPRVSMSSPISGVFPILPTASDFRKKPIGRMDSPLDEAENPITRDQAGQGPTLRHSTEMPPTSSGSDGLIGRKSSMGVRFVLVKPDEPKDKKEETENRKWVMHDYLKKERQNPNSTDPRASTETQPGRKRRLQNVSSCLSTGGPLRGLRPGKSDQSSETKKPHSNASQASSVSDSLDESSAAVEVRSNASSNSPETSRSTRVRVDPGSIDAALSMANDQSLVPGFPGRFPSAGYMSTSLADVPFPPERFGGNVNTFETWPVFSDRKLNVTDLKWRCAMRFATRGMALQWVPALLKARHAFLSTICISSAYDDIMSRSYMPSSERQARPLSYERWHVRGEVISMINKSLGDPDLRIADSTIIAVLHLLMSEIMGCNDGTMRVHQEGLLKMVRQRGGLGQLGINGHLAHILTIAMYVMGIVRETPPSREFAAYGAQQYTKITDDAGPLPESPVCCKAAGYSTLNRSLPTEGATIRLLSKLRILTNKFFDQHAHETQSSQTPFRQARFFDQSEDDLLGLRDQIFALPAGKDVTEFGNVHDRNVYESIRLTALLYSHALAMHLPFSVAAAHLQCQSSQQTASSAKGDSQPQESSIFLPIRIRNALLQTNTSALWEQMAGTLFWVGLVAGAAANPGSLTQEDRVGEAEDARKWLAAIVVRCAIVLNFDYGDAMLETVKRMIGIEAVLMLDGRAGGMNNVQGAVVNTEARDENGQPIVGPPEVMQTFSDLAHEFQGS